MVVLVCEEDIATRIVLEHSSAIGINGNSSNQMI